MKLLRRLFGLLSRLFYRLFVLFENLAFDGTFVAALIGSSFSEDESRELLFGFGPKRLKRGVRATFETRIMAENFTPERLIVPDRIGRHFVLHALNIEGREQLLGTIPCQAFSEKSVGAVISTDVTAAGQKIEMIVERIS